MRRDDIFMVMDLLDSSPVIGYYDILTNGSLIKNEDLSQLRCQKKLRRIQLSLESPDPLINDAIRVEGAFNTTIDIIRRLKDLGFQVGIMMTVSRLNMNNIEDMVNLLVEEKVDTLSVERFIPEGAGSAMNESMLSQEEARRLFEKIYSLGINESRIRILMYRPLFAIIESNDPTVGAMCSVGMNALTIMHDGTIFPCRRLPLPIGHVLNGGIFKAWYDSDLLWEIRQSGNLKGKCGECELIPLCRGCRAMAYYVTGDYLEEDPHCWKVMVAGTN